MKVRVDKSMGIVTLLPEVLDNQTSRALPSMLCAESENGFAVLLVPGKWTQDD